MGIRVDKRTLHIIIGVLLFISLMFPWVTFRASVIGTEFSLKVSFIKTLIIISEPMESSSTGELIFEVPYEAKFLGWTVLAMTILTFPVLIIGLVWRKIEGWYSPFAIIGSLSWWQFVSSFEVNPKYAGILIIEVGSGAIMCLILGFIGLALNFIEFTEVKKEVEVIEGESEK